MEQENSTPAERTITARTDYDFPTLLDMKRVEVQTTGSRRVKYYRMAFLVVAAFCAALAVSFFIEGSETFGQAVVYLLLGVLMLVLRAYYPEVAAWRTKRMLKRHPVFDEYDFWEDEFQISRVQEKTVSLLQSGTGQGRDSTVYPYEECNSLLETELAFYLFHNRGRGMVIAKRGVQGCTPEELKALLEERCGLTARWMDHKSK